MSDVNGNHGDPEGDPEGGDDPFERFLAASDDPEPEEPDKLLTKNASNCKVGARGGVLFGVNQVVWKLEVRPLDAAAAPGVKTRPRGLKEHELNRSQDEWKSLNEEIRGEICVVKFDDNHLNPKRSKKYCQVCWWQCIVLICEKN